MSTKKAKNSYIQIVRALAIIAVVLIHNLPNAEWVILIRPLLNFCVATFLFLSGFLTSDKITDLYAFYKKRILRVFLPYLIWSVLYTISSSNFSVKDFFFHLFTGQCCNIYYYILVYIQLILITPLLIKLTKSKIWKIGFFITPIAIIIEILLEIKGTPLNFPYNANNCLVWLIFYYFGLCIKNKTIILKERAYFKIYLLCMFTQLLAALFWFKMGNINLATTQIKLTSMITSLSFCTFLVYRKSYFEDKINLLLKKKNVIIKVLILIGNYSFGIYLTHLLLMNILSSTIYRLFLPPFLLRGIIIISLEVFFIRMLIIIFKKYKINDKIFKYLGFV